ncbi:DNA-processing protein DprA [uncultured Mailhella sp.]|uniref:DNA-processing protein DprA n=1 Tax=uncultured Mailhella sp. TaxID=1981031 RepID=UPI0025FE836A|nr:DNA-processing protein DprA [uncultured Mailhella sp.]
MTVRPSSGTGLAALDDDGRREYWAALALRHTAGLGARGAHLLVSHFDSAYDAVMNVPRWPEAGVPAQKAEGYLNNAWRLRARPEWEASRTLQASIILWTDKRYPSLLKELPDAPVLLYAVGDTALLGAPCVAVVGSRNSSPAALDFTAVVAEELSLAGVTVVSGLAFGVDGCAHKAALSGPGRSIAVLPGGVDKAFPAGHRELYGRMAERGLLVSEMPPGWVPGPGAFPVRNRIISGLSLGVLVTEAVHARSGSLITAHLAAEQGRNVYVPSPNALRSPCPEGSKKLLLEGARPIFRADDILADLLPHLRSAAGRPFPAPRASSKAQAAFSETQPEPPLEQCPDAREQMRENALSRHAQPSPSPAVTTAGELSAGEAPVSAPSIRETGADSRASVDASDTQKEKKRPPASSLPPLTEEEETILALLKNGPLTQDELLYAAQKESPSWTSASVSAVLMILEVKRLARRLTDTRYEART